MPGLFTLIGAGAGAYFGGPAGAAAGIALGSGIDSSIGQDDANRKNYQMYEDSRDWQERMSNTAVSRSATDFQNAGFNRLLATGAQASTPAPAMQRMENAAAPLQASAKDAVTNVLGAQQTASNIKKQDADIKTQDTNRSLMESQKTQAEAQSKASLAQAKLNDANTLKATVEAQAARKSIPEADFKNDMYDIFRPGIKKIKEYFQTSPLKDPSTNNRALDQYKSYKLKAGKP